LQVSAELEVVKVVPVDAVLNQILR